MPDRLTALLARLDLQDYLSLFRDNDVDDALLPELTSDDLKEIGIRSLGHRKRILAAIAEECGQADKPAEVETDTRRPDPSARESGASNQSNKSNQFNQPDTPTAAAETSLDDATTQRREVTTLFADLTDYTRLSRELEAEDMHVLLGGFFERFDALVRRIGGTVDRHIGDCVMAVFGAPVSHGNDAERALRAAMEMHREMAELSRQFGRELSVHIGVANGRVLFSREGQGADRERGMTLTGDSVNLASRLADQANPGETLLLASIKYALGERIVCDEAMRISVQGVDEPVAVHRLIQFSQDGADRGALVGRTAEVSLFDEALTRCTRQDRGSVVAVVADAGVGKTRLIEEFVDRARASGFETVKALILDFGLGEKNDPLRALVGGLLGLSETAETSAVRSALNQLVQHGVLDDQAQMFLTIAMGAPLDRAQELVYEAMTDAGRREGRHRALRQLAHGRARQQPLLLVVEDVHWATTDTLDTLAVIANASAEAPLVLLISSRMDGNPLEGEWVQTIDQARLRRIALEPLSMDEAVELARQTHGLSEEVLDECVRRAEGNPLFLEQLLRHASERTRDTVPGSIQSIVQARIDRLSATDRRALQGAAVVGQRFSLQVAMAVADLEVYDERALVDAGLIRPIREGYLFAHALIRDAVLQTILRDDLRAMHLRAAEFFRTRDTVLYAEHLAAARDARAAGAFLAASREMQRTHRKDAALELATRGLAFDSDAPTRAALLRLAGDMRRELGETDGALDAFKRARDAAPGVQDRCRAQIGEIATLRIMDQIDAAYEILDEAETAAREADLAAELSEIHYLRGSLHFPKGYIEGCLDEHRKSLDCAERAQLVERRALALSGLGDAHYAAGRMFTAHESISQCLELAREHSLGAVEAANRFMLATVKIYMNETEQALADALGSADLARQVGHARAEIVSRLTAGWVLVSMADRDAARREANLGLEIAERLGAKRFEPFLQETLARVELMEGNRARASETAETALATLRELGTMSFIGPWLLSTVALCTGQAARRHDALAEGERLLGEGSIGHNHFRFHRYAAQACLDAGETDAARRQADLLERFTAPEPTPWSSFHIARIRALADAAEGYDVAAELGRLREEAEAAALYAAIPALDGALKHARQPAPSSNVKAEQGG